MAINMSTLEGKKLGKNKQKGEFTTSDTGADGASKQARKIETKKKRKK